MVRVFVDEALKFQFYLSSIKSTPNRPVVPCFGMFQFYLSSIKRQPEYRGIEERNMFQFYLSSIKSVTLDNVRAIVPGFNSTLVQLKGMGSTKELQPG